MLKWGVIPVNLKVYFDLFYEYFTLVHSNVGSEKYYWTKIMQIACY